MSPRRVIAFAFAAALLQASLVATGGRSHAVKPLFAASWTRAEEVDDMLLDILTAAVAVTEPLGGSLDFDLKDTESHLRPPYKTLPKNQNEPSVDVVDELPWSQEEELLAHDHSQGFFAELVSLLRGLALVVLLAVFAVNAQDVYAPAVAASRGKAPLPLRLKSRQV
eukprot:CAMPEP_0203881430 /NCGR_PEP_ID=MMETSP0359-20131031/25723_1 /ASSEMBLY_ACC=CAM_ASM_000338 /TAXON_ID=268821 /ORGANISM="Scrippsiella Hangoei, Strain SHTV-5" /LENGTH=166 /DNA_ID=CAMNT_0050801251 /DNA_START=28 /DNA_END=529 /DNA_ORIENTATION=-